MSNHINYPKGDKILVTIIEKAIRIPGVKVNREAFLRGSFKDASPQMLESIVADGPVIAGYSADELKKKVTNLINTRTLESSGVSFAAGIPGGLAMGATIPADLVQFYGFALRLSQEISYLYGADDMWHNGVLDIDAVTNRLILYCGVMFGAAGASALTRVIASRLAEQALKKIPNAALMKTLFYPTIKVICKFIGVKMTKDIFAKGVAKAIPIAGGVVSGGITLLSMRPMGKRLAKAFEEANFDYSEDKFKKDWDEVIEVTYTDITDSQNDIDPEINTDQNKANIPKDDIATRLKNAKELLDAGLITEDDYNKVKQRILDSI